MTLVVQWWFFVPFGKRGRVLHPLPVNHPQCPFIQMTDTDVTFLSASLSCYNTVGDGSYTYVRHHPYLPSTPATLQTLGRVEYATTPDSRIVTPLILILFSQGRLSAPITQSRHPDVRSNHTAAH
jgi:hypothetical protein